MNQQSCKVQYKSMNALKINDLNKIFKQTLGWNCSCFFFVCDCLNMIDFIKCKYCDVLKALVESDKIIKKNFLFHYNNFQESNMYRKFLTRLSYINLCDKYFTNPTNFLSLFAGIYSDKMDQQQQYCLKWSNYSSNMAMAFSNLYESDTLTDVILLCGGELFHFK